MLMNSVQKTKNTALKQTIYIYIHTHIYICVYIYITYMHLYPTMSHKALW